MRKLTTLIMILVICYSLICVPTYAATKGEENALASAKNYLSIMNFSYKGIIEQLEYDGYLASECQFAADNCEADWYDQAAGSAKQYLSIMSFSKKGLVEQLEYDGYTESEAQFAADNCEADWYDQAAGSAKQYLSIMSFSKKGLIEQLEYDGYTESEAEYGAAIAYDESPQKPNGSDKTSEAITEEGT